MTSQYLNSVIIPMNDILRRRLSAVNRTMTNALTHFLTNSRQRYLDDIRATPARGSEWTVVMGNEAGGELVNRHQPLTSTNHNQGRPRHTRQLYRICLLLLNTWKNPECSRLTTRSRRLVVAHRKHIRVIISWHHKPRVPDPFSLRYTLAFPVPHIRPRRPQQTGNAVLIAVCRRHSHHRSPRRRKPTFDREPADRCTRRELLFTYHPLVG